MSRNIPKDWDESMKDLDAKTIRFIISFTHDDEEALVDGHDDCQHQHFQRGVLARNGEEAQDDGDEAERMRQIVL